MGARLSKLSAAERALEAQKAMGGAFLAMGAACVLAPETVLNMSLAQPKGVADNATSRLIFQCFGSQAMLCGTLLAVSKLDRRGFAVWGSCMVPYVVFDAHYYAKGALSPLGAIGDLAGNVFFLACSAYSYSALKPETKVT